MPVNDPANRATRRRRHRRILGAVAAITAGSLGLAACGGGSSPTAGSSGNGSITPAVPKGPITLTEYDYYTTGSQQTAVKAAISAFEKKYPNVKIERQAVPYPSVNKLVTIEAAGNSPNIVIEDQDYLAQYYAGLVPMTTFFSKSFISKYLPGGTESATLNGQKYGLQVLGGNDTALIYNKTDFKQAGITKPPSTWAELVTDAAKLTDPKANRYGFAVSGSQQEGSAWQLEPFVWSDGGTLSQPNAAPWHRSMNLWNTMIQKGYMPRAVTGWAQTDEQNHFMDNNVAMQINGPWNIPQLEQSNLKWGVAPYPTRVAGQTVAVPIGGEAWCIGKSTTEKEAASAAFIQFLTDNTKLNLQLTHEMGYMPALKDEDPTYAKQYPEFAPFAKEFQHARARVYGQNYLKVSTAIQVMIGNVLSGKQGVNQALTSLQSQISAIPR